MLASEGVSLAFCFLELFLCMAKICCNGSHFFEVIFRGRGEVLMYGSNCIGYISFVPFARECNSPKAMLQIHLIQLWRPRGKMSESAFVVGFSEQLSKLKINLFQLFVMCWCKMCHFLQ